MLVNTKEVDLDLVDLENTRYRTRFVCSVSDPGFIDLAKSIESVGIINPPILSFVSGKYIVVSGVKRLLAAKKIGLNKVICQVCDGDPVVAYKIAIIENSYISTYTELDKALIVRKLFGFLGDNAISSVSDILGGISGLRMNKEYINKLIKLNDMSNDIKDAISKGIVSPAIILEFDFWGNSDSEILLFFLQHLKIGLNLQREFCNLLYEISKVAECGVSDILSGEIFTNIIKSSVDISKKREQIISELRKIRYPHIEKAKNEFAETVTKIVNGDHEILFMRPKNMESSEVSVSFSFKTRSDFIRIVRKLEKTGHHPGFDSLLISNITI